MGPGRSIRKVSKKPRVSRHLKRWSKKWKWVQRAAAYDRWMEAKNLETAELFAEQEEKERQQRERDRREKLFQLGQQFIHAADLMFKVRIACLPHAVRGPVRPEQPPGLLPPWVEA
jgi:hypothetical protein